MCARQTSHPKTRMISEHLVLRMWMVLRSSEHMAKKQNRKGWWRGPPWSASKIKKSVNRRSMAFLGTAKLLLKIWICAQNKHFLGMSSGMSSKCGLLCHVTLAFCPAELQIGGHSTTSHIQRYTSFQMDQTAWGPSKNRCPCVFSMNAGMCVWVCQSPYPIIINSFTTVENETTDWYSSSS